MMIDPLSLALHLTLDLNINFEFSSALSVVLIAGFSAYKDRQRIKMM